jgi:hypothetical protein
MRKHIICEAGGRRIRIAWLSFQSDGSISFGLQEKTFVSPKLRIRQGLWNAFNRRRLRFEIPSDPDALTPIRNPHFTYHPPGLFHLKANTDRSSEDEEIFRGVARVAVVLDQETKMPWVKAITGPLCQLPSGGVRSDSIKAEELVLTVPSDRMSMCIAIDFVKPEYAGQIEYLSCWCVPWHDVALRIALSFTFPQIPMLTWRHDS